MLRLLLRKGDETRYLLRRVANSDESFEVSLLEILEDKDKSIAFLARLIRNIISGVEITEDEEQALDNIICELPPVDAKEFRW